MRIERRKVVREGARFLYPLASMLAHVSVLLGDTSEGGNGGEEEAGNRGAYCCTSASRTATNLHPSRGCGCIGGGKRCEHACQGKQKRSRTKLESTPRASSHGHFSRPWWQPAAPEVSWLELPGFECARVRTAPLTGRERHVGFRHHRGMKGKTIGRQTDTGTRTFY